MVAATQSNGTGDGALIVGMGELGGIFALGLLRRGISVVPVLRSTTSESVTRQCREPSLCVIAVGEEALAGVLDGWLRRHSDRWVLIQNELRPSEWEHRGIPTPTVAVVWFEKKPGRDVRPLVSSPVYGTYAPVIVHALAGLGLPAHIELDPERLVFELALKNLYVLATNFCGLLHSTDVGTLWHTHRSLFDHVCDEVLELECAQMQRSLPTQSLKIDLERIVLADPRHMAAGRKARSRLTRTMATASRLGLKTPVLADIARCAEER